MKKFDPGRKMQNGDPLRFTLISPPKDSIRLGIQWTNWIDKLDLYYFDMAEEHITFVLRN